jgi:3-hydroxybutyryl-CoA dehydrogenase
MRLKMPPMTEMMSGEALRVGIIWQAKRIGMKIVVSGDKQFAQEIGRLCEGAGHDVSHIDPSVLGDGNKLKVEGGEGEMAGWQIAIDVQNSDLDVKRSTLQLFSSLIGHSGVCLTLAYAVSVTEAASWMENPQRLVGFGVVPPLESPGVVEIARGLLTADDVIEEAATFWHSLDMETIEVKEGPGLVRARTVSCLVNEAASALMEGVASAGDIDAAMRLGTNFPYGPLEWGDIIGLDNVLAVLNGLYREYGEDRYRPSPLLKRMVYAGELGKKSGRGFYTYEPDGVRMKA